jgi:hypothetical protein
MFEGKAHMHEMGYHVLAWPKIVLRLEIGQRCLSLIFGIQFWDWLTAVFLQDIVVTFQWYLSG